ncbi:sensor domain-containing diguanylate cyclase [Modestobacter altitudinis]|uniref:sensor domain-containing diguanylate cyclase n=1 Tax=Modestobacter altitudinis TaxID=2213158 RepID=UPI00110CF1E4|nr:GGDEF domain-containing protein [Modestobacter altitudinis]
MDHEVAFDHAPLGVALTSTSGVLRTVNAAFAELLGMPPADLAGRSLLSLTHPEDVPAAEDACRSVSRTHSRRLLHECRLVHQDGSTVPVQVTTSWVDGAAGAHLVMMVEDISARLAREDGLRRLGLQDPLTGLGNRTQFRDRLEHALQRGRRDGRATCLVLLDVDDFKAVNDRHGHPVGDLVLVNVGRLLQQSSRHSDSAARIGGDEFAIVCEDTSPGDAAQLVDRLRHGLRTAMLIGRAEVLVSLSAGVAVSSPDADPLVEVDELISRADVALYADKSRGGRTATAHPPR